MNNTQINTQLELDFAGNVPRRPVGRRRCRLPNAGWWFNQIRALIDSPQDVPAVRPVQCRLALLPTR